MPFGLVIRESEAELVEARGYRVPAGRTSPRLELERRWGRPLVLILLAVSIAMDAASFFSIRSILREPVSEWDLPAVIFFSLMGVATTYATLSNLLNVTGSLSTAGGCG
jgi:hypothetical protein